LFPSGWCAFLDQASRPAQAEAGSADLPGVRNVCQASCWHASRAAIESGREVEQPCGSGIEMFAVPIRAGGRVVGAINAAIGEPPRDEETLIRLADAYGVPSDALAQQVATYPSLTPEAVETAKQRLRLAAQLIGEKVAREAAEREQQRLLEAEAKARSRLQRLQVATAELAVALTPDQVATVTLEAAMRHAGSSRGSVLLLDRAGRTLNLAASRGYESAQLAPWQQLSGDGRHPPGDALRSLRPVVIGSQDALLERYPELADWAREAGVRATVVLPLLVGAGPARRLMGTVCLGFDREREFEGDEVDFLETLASVSAQAMDRALAYDAERAARVEAEHANETKAAFLAVMSHELRTPLNAIGGYAQLLEMGLHGPVTAQQLEALGRITFNQQHLLERINDILDFARLEAGKVSFHIEDVPLGEVVEGVMRMMESVISAKELACEVVLPDPAPMVRADAARLRQVLVNLLANAAKYTEAGGRIRLEVAPSSGGVKIRIFDTGSGIPAEKLEAIFRPFERVDNGFTRTTEGAGLGLAIARDLARGMGGDLVVASVVGEGSVFTVTVPAATPAS
ncbi:MAG TPA: ATP-binding protein, partial [Longimicrobiales bacterium]